MAFSVVVIFERRLTPIGKITRACGFRSENHAKNLFKSRFGISMRDYRASQGSG